MAEQSIGERLNYHLTAVTELLAEARSLSDTEKAALVLIISQHERLVRERIAALRANKKPWQPKVTKAPLTEVKF